MATEITEPVAANCYEFESSIEALAEFNRVCGMFFYFLGNQNLSWAISCNNEYCLFAGERTFIEHVFGSSVEKAEKHFMRFAEAAFGAIKRDLLVVSEMYILMNNDRR